MKLLNFIFTLTRRNRFSPNLVLKKKKSCSGTANVSAKFQSTANFYSWAGRSLKRSCQNRNLQEPRKKKRNTSPALPLISLGVEVKRYYTILQSWKAYTPLQYSCLEKSHGQRSLVGCSLWGRWVGHDWATSLSLFTFHFHALEKEMATYSSVLAWRIPGMEEPVRLPSVGSHRVGHADTT